MSETYARGDRVELDRCEDPDTLLKPGDQGTVGFIDDLGTAHIKWDNGSRLGLNKTLGDEFHKIPVLAVVKP
jgi:hypothetical protein